MISELNENDSALSDQLRKNAQESLITYEIHNEEVKELEGQVSSLKKQLTESKSVLKVRNSEFDMLKTKLVEF